MLQSIKSCLYLDLSAAGAYWSDLSPSCWFKYKYLLGNISNCLQKMQKFSGQTFLASSVVVSYIQI
jgi:hypothetical protein